MTNLQSYSNRSMYSNGGFDVWVWVKSMKNPTPTTQYLLLYVAISNVYRIEGPPVGVCVSCTVACVIRQMFSFPDHSACMGSVHPAAPSHQPLLSITDRDRGYPCPCPSPLYWSLKLRLSEGSRRFHNHGEGPYWAL